MVENLKARWALATSNPFHCLHVVTDYFPLMWKQIRDGRAVAGDCDRIGCSVVDLARGVWVALDIFGFVLHNWVVQF